MHDIEKKHILLIEDNRSFADMLALYLQQQNYRVSIAHQSEKAFQYIHGPENLDAIILDLKLSDSDGLDILKKLRDSGFDHPVIISTGYGSINIAIEAMRAGASDFLVKPYDLEKLGTTLQRSFEGRGLKTKAELVEESENRRATFSDNIAGVESENNSESKLGGFIGTSQPMQVVYDIIENAAKSSATVFITGESGTGKEICAEAIHKLSDRAGNSFIVLNCAAIPRDLLESELFGHVKGAFTGAVSDRDGAARRAHGGTLFLDEVGEMPLDMQTKLLRFLQDLSFQKVGGNENETTDVRIICATNRDPLAEILANRFRRDLYYRLHVIPIHMPALRERCDDLLDIANYFLLKFAEQEGKSFSQFSSETEKALLSYGWPGNVRELQNVVRNVVVLNEGDIVKIDMLPPVVFVPHNLYSLEAAGGEHGPAEIPPLWRVEKEAIEHAIAVCDGNIPKAAALLEISPSTIYRKKMGWEAERPEA